MIYLITGVPGSGKSLYAVAKLLQDLLKEKIRREDGTTIERRLCVDGIPDLLLPHELMTPGRDASLIARGKDEGEHAAEGHGLWNWFEWCRPGDVICVDEVQRYWRPRGMGTKVPTDIAKLETHRHYGVDLVLITQNAMLLDQNVRRLVGRHMHVRRLFGGSRALIYDWDGCNTDTSRLSGGTRTLFTYDRKAYSLYKSSELHTKQRQKIPLWFAFPLVVLALGAFAGPKAWDAMHKATTGKALTAAGPQGVVSPAKVPASGAAGLSSSPGPVVAASAASVTQRRVIGCVASKDRCQCIDEAGQIAKMEPAMCRDGVERVGSVVALDMASRGAPVPAYLQPEPEKPSPMYVVPNSSGQSVQGYDPDRQSMPAKSVFAGGGR